MGINQRYSVYDQLVIGVRFLHLEISLHHGEWCTIHSFKDGTLRRDLMEIRRFVMIPGSSHFTLLYPQLFRNEPSDMDSSGRTYLTAISDILGTYQRAYRPEDPIVTYYNQVAIVDGAFFSVPPDSTTNWKTFLHNRSTKTCPDPFLHWVMTPDVATITRSVVLPFTTHRSLSTLYPTNHENLREYLRSSPPSTHRQCIIVDHVDPEFVEIVDAQNRD